MSYCFLSDVAVFKMWLGEIGCLCWLCVGRVRNEARLRWCSECKNGAGWKWMGWWHNLGGSTPQVKRHFTTVKDTAICPDVNKLQPLVVGTEQQSKTRWPRTANERRQNAWDWMRSKLKQATLTAAPAVVVVACYRLRRIRTYDIPLFVFAMLTNIKKTIK